MQLLGGRGAGASLTLEPFPSPAVPDPPHLTYTTRPLLAHPYRRQERV